jgi:L,D-peptidoglycan transpeptidase YkuD (ErfK/YbiS/YcfS/YnhG family)
MSLLLVFLTTVFSALFIPGYAAVANANEKPLEADVLPWMKTVFEKKAGESDQVILVLGSVSELSSATIYTFEKHNNRWEVMLKPVDASIGRNGFALPDLKREGDGRTPSGVYALKYTFGYLPAIDTKMHYFQTTEDDVWVDDADSIDYNQWLKRGHTKAASFEDMRRKDIMYKYVIVIAYNTNPVIRGIGSAIFFHVWKKKGKPTAGCIAMSEENIISILNWLDPSRKPLVIIGTEDTLKGMAR